MTKIKCSVCGRAVCGLIRIGIQYLCTDCVAKALFEKNEEIQALKESIDLLEKLHREDHDWRVAAEQAVATERKRYRQEEVAPLMTALTAMQANLRDQHYWQENIRAVEHIQKEKP